MNAEQTKIKGDDDVSKLIIAVDFDGTLCENAWPDIGSPKIPVIEYVRRQKETGAEIILWTNRTGQRLDEAVRWCREHGIEFDAVNENLTRMIKVFGSDPRKVYADIYLDDRMIPLPSKVNARGRRRY